MSGYKPEGIYAGMTQAEALRELAEFCPSEDLDRAWLREAMATLARLPERPKASGWRDIETAPKDGSTVILYWGGGQVCPGSYLDNSSPDPLTSWAGWRPPSGQPWPKGQPTKWQPLPPPPGEGDNIDTVDNTDTIYQHAHRASVRSTIATSMKREEALRAENAELKAVAQDAVDLITEAFAEHKSEKIAAAQDRLRSALSPKEKE